MNIYIFVDAGFIKEGGGRGVILGILGPVAFRKTL